MPDSAIQTQLLQAQNIFCCAKNQHRLGLVIKIKDLFNRLVTMFYGEILLCKIEDSDDALNSVRNGKLQLFPESNRT